MIIFPSLRPTYKTKTLPPKIPQTNPFPPPQQIKFTNLQSPTPHQLSIPKTHLQNQKPISGNPTKYLSTSSPNQNHKPKPITTQTSPPPKTTKTHHPAVLSRSKDYESQSHFSPLPTTQNPIIKERR